MSGLRCQDFIYRYLFHNFHFEDINFFKDVIYFLWGCCFVLFVLRSYGRTFRDSRWGCSRTKRIRSKKQIAENHEIFVQQHFFKIKALSSTFFNDAAFERIMMVSTFHKVIFFCLRCFFCEQKHIHTGTAMKRELLYGHALILLMANIRHHLRCIKPY